MFKTIHTAAGLRAMAAAAAAGRALELTEMAVGDGAGADVTPDPEQTTLVAERHRASVNRVFKPDPQGRPNVYAAEMVVPANVGGFTLREVGLFDNLGALIAVGSLPPTYKPSDSEGAFADTTIRLEFEPTNAETITISADPNTALATRSWVEQTISETVTTCYVLPGGTTGQTLRKASDACGDVEWADPGQVNVVVDTIDEVQTLGSGQTQVDLVEVTNAGLAVYVDGERIPQIAGADGWQPDGSILTRIHLGQSYPAGTRLILVQNEPAADLPAYLRQSQNLADVSSKSAARANLDVFSRAEVIMRVPPGCVMMFASAVVPSGWLQCNGAWVSRAAYPDLYDAIGNRYGEGEISFRLPDLRGEFIRGWDAGRGVDPGRVLGSAQSDEIRAHDHRVLEGSAYPQIDDTPGVLTSGDDYTDLIGSYSRTGETGGGETRPRNVTMHFIIKT